MELEAPRTPLVIRETFVLAYNIHRPPIPIFWRQFFSHSITHIETLADNVDTDGMDAHRMNKIEE